MYDAIDRLNVASAAYAKELTSKWMFTGWKPAQGNTRLHAQWLRADEYDGQRYYSSIQCCPVELGDCENLEVAQEYMKSALEDIVLFDKLAPEPVPWK